MKTLERLQSCSTQSVGTINKQQIKQTKIALAFFKKALPIAEKLAANKSNVQAQQDLKDVQDAIDSVQAETKK
jgi:hypothetical protein